MAGGCVGLVEFTSIAKGIEATDALLKTADVSLIMSSTFCAGKYISVFSGEVSAVQAAADSAIALGGNTVVDSFVAPSVHPSVFPALSATTQVETLGAMGVIETFTAASAIVAADAAAKGAPVDLVEIRLCNGMGGKAFVIMTGETSAVQAAVEIGSGHARRQGLLVSQVVIPRPHPDLWQSVV